MTSEVYMYVNPDEIIMVEETHFINYFDLKKCYYNFIHPYFDIALITDLDNLLANQLLLGLGEDVEDELVKCELGDHVPTDVLRGFLIQMNRYIRTIEMTIRYILVNYLITGFTVNADRLYINTVRYKYPN